MGAVTVETVIEDPRWRMLDLPVLAGRAARATFDHLMLGQGWSIAVLACDDGRIAALNADFRASFRPTNVLSWPSEERAATLAGGDPAPPDGSELGDIAIAYDTCAAEARTAGRPMADHVTHLIVHGVLHLLGYDHERDPDAALMERHERDILCALGISDPYATREFLTER